jgi:predicted dinucleotide-binding enzyme
MNIAFIGYGQVGGALATRLQTLGHHVTLATKDPNSPKALAALARHSGLKALAPELAVHNAEIVFLATPFMANEAALSGLKDALRGKVLVDCTNPIGAGFKHGLNNVQSGTEWLQSMLPETRVVKAFTIYGFENFENNQYPGYNVKPAMLFCGNDAGAKLAVSQLIEELGWQPMDVGGADQALHLEHMTIMWVKYVRVQGHAPGLVWAALAKN